MYAHPFFIAGTTEASASSEDENYTYSPCASSEDTIGSLTSSKTYLYTSFHEMPSHAEGSKLNMNQPSMRVTPPPSTAYNNADVKYYTNVINNECARVGDWKKAEQIMTVMQR
jgi:hypothetical protein